LGTRRYAFTRRTLMDVSSIDTWTEAPVRRGRHPHARARTHTYASARTSPGCVQVISDPLRRGVSREEQERQARSSNTIQVNVSLDCGTPLTRRKQISIPVGDRGNECGHGTRHKEREGGCYSRFYFLRLRLMCCQE
jgi:hypothetical protein